MVYFKRGKKKSESEKKLIKGHKLIIKVGEFLSYSNG